MTGWISIDRKFFIFRKSLAELFPKTSSREVLWRKLDNGILWFFFVCEKRWNVNQQIIFRDNEMSLKLISVWGESERVKILKRIPILAKQDAPKIQKQKNETRTPQRPFRTDEEQITLSIDTMLTTRRRRWRWFEKLSVPNEIFPWLHPKIDSERCYLFCDR